MRIVIGGMISMGLLVGTGCGRCPDAEDVTIDGEVGPGGVDQVRRSLAAIQGSTRLKACVAKVTFTGEQGPEDHPWGVLRGRRIVTRDPGTLTHMVYHAIDEQNGLSRRFPYLPGDLSSGLLATSLVELPEEGREARREALALTMDAARFAPHLMGSVQEVCEDSPDFFDPPLAWVAAEVWQTHTYDYLKDTTSSAIVWADVDTLSSRVDVLAGIGDHVVVRTLRSTVAVLEVDGSARELELDLGPDDSLVSLYDSDQAPVGTFRDGRSFWLGQIDLQTGAIQRLSVDFTDLVGRGFVVGRALIVLSDEGSRQIDLDTGAVLPIDHRLDWPDELPLAAAAIDGKLHFREGFLRTPGGQANLRTWDPAARAFVASEEGESFVALGRVPFLATPTSASTLEGLDYSVDRSLTQLVALPVSADPEGVRAPREICRGAEDALVLPGELGDGYAVVKYVGGRPVYLRWANSGSELLGLQIGELE